MGRLVALGLFERAEDQTFVPTKGLRQVEIEPGMRDYCDYRRRKRLAGTLTRQPSGSRSRSYEAVELMRGGDR
jgi:hypothetical protein